MASSKRRGLGETLKEILARAQTPRFTFSRQGDMGPVLRSVLRSRRSRDESTPPTASSRGRARPGLGEPGLERIQEALAEFREEPPAPPEEPPVEETEEEESLPLPEYIVPIEQSTKNPGFGARRPDLHSEFYGDGNKNSTRVHALQWIPLMQTTDGGSGEVFGDILVAFARPSRKQQSSDAGSLYIYRSKTQDVWNVLKSSTSLGRSVKQLLGTGVPYDSGYDDYYRKFHPSYTGRFIFDEKEKWRVIRENNEVSGASKSKAVEEAFKEIDIFSIATGKKSKE